MSDLSSWPPRCSLLWASVVVFLVHAALPFAHADQLKLDALVQEGDLILEEAATLAPSDAQLADEERRLIASENELCEEVQSLNQGITQFNAAMAEQNQAVQKAQNQCPPRTDDQALAEACDQRMAQLRDQANLLEDERLQLRARQEELNARVDRQNAWGREFAKRKHAQGSNDKLNQRDSEEWLGRAKEFLASQDFAALLAQAGSPAACGADQTKDISALGTRAALERVQACLRAVKAGHQ